MVTPLPFSSPPAAGSSPTGAYTLDVYGGFARYQAVIKPGCWVPVWAELGARAADIQGSLLLRQPRNQLQLDLPIQVSKGSRKRYLGTYRFDAQLDPVLEVELRLGRSGRDAFTLPLRFADEGEQHILVLAESLGGFAFLNRDGIDLSLGTDGTTESASSLRQRAAARRSQQWTPGGIGGARVIYGDPDFLPEDPIALESLDGVVVTTSRVRALTPRQGEALRGWVMAGGNLLLAGGRLQPFIEHSVLNGAFGLSLAPAEPVVASEVFNNKNNHPLPHSLNLHSINKNWKRVLHDPGGDTTKDENGRIVTVTETSEAVGIDYDYEHEHEDIFKGEGEKKSVTSATLLVSWPVGDWTRRELGDARHPLVVGKRAGRGWFHLCAAALDEPFLTLAASRSSAARLWPLLLERHLGQSPLEFIAGPGEGTLAFDLQRAFNFNLVGPGWVAVYLGCYLLLALPLAWFVCGRLRRREWAWPAAVALALAFSGFGCLRGLRGQPGFFQAGEMTLIMQPAGAPAARVATFSAIFSPRRFSADLPLPPGLHLDRSISELYGNRYSGRADDLYDGRGLNLRLTSGAPVLGGFFFHPWSLRTLRADFTTSSGGVIAERPLALDDAGKPLAGGRIVNRSPWTFNRWWLTDGRNYWRGSGTLARGTRVTLGPATFAVPTPAPTPFYNRDGNPIDPAKNPLYARDSFCLIAGQSVESNILVPILREASPSSFDPRDVQSFLKNWNFTRIYESTRDARGGLFFLGEAAGALSPITTALPLERRHGVLLYEAALPVVQSTALDGVRPTRWCPDLLDPQAKQHTQYGYYRSRPTTNTAELTLEFLETDIRLIPDRPLPPEADGTLTFAFRLATRPNPEALFISSAEWERLRMAGAFANYEIDPVTGLPAGAIDPVTGMPLDPTGVQIATLNRGVPDPNPMPTATPDPKIKPLALYKFAGCPVWVYNLRLRKWEPTRVLEDGRHTVSPLQDYLDPATSNLALRIEADKSRLRLRRVEAGRAGEIKTGQELWGENDRELNYHNYSCTLANMARQHQNDGTPSGRAKIPDPDVDSLLLTGLTVTYGEATATSSSLAPEPQNERRKP